MKREDAIQEIKTTITWLRDEVLDEQTAIMTDIALTTLAPAVRYDRPTVEEVGGADRVWGKIGTSWMLTSGQELRRYWIGSKHTHPLVYPFTAWLPYSAIPEGGA